MNKKNDDGVGGWILAIGMAVMAVYLAYSLLIIAIVLEWWQ